MQRIRQNYTSVSFWRMSLSLDRCGRFESYYLCDLELIDLFDKVVIKHLYCVILTVI